MNEKDESTSIKGFPNYELKWDDKELFPGKWTEDEDCHGLVGQKYPEPFLVRLMNEIEHRADRKEAVKLIQEFPQKLESLSTSQEQIQRQIKARLEKRHFKRPDWVCEASVEHFLEVPPEPWWMRLRSITVVYRLKLEEIARVRAEKKASKGFYDDSFVPDYPFEEEVSKGEWD